MSRRSRHLASLQSALAAVREIYADLAMRPIQRNCVRKGECCHFKLTGRNPYLTKCEALLAAHAFRATGRKSLPDNPNSACPMLQSSTGSLLDLRMTGPSDAEPISAAQPADLTREAKSSI